MAGQWIGSKLINWASAIDPAALRQAQQTADLSYVQPHVALMPDAHLGRGATVGSVLPTVGAVIPAAVGVDIGCGMIAVRTQWVEEQVKGAGALSRLRKDIEARIPLSAGKSNRNLSVSAHHRVDELRRLWTDSGITGDPSDYAKRWDLQLGTLGSGNHFIEVTVDEESRVWAFLHSGSRGVGNRIAQHHIRVAQQECEDAGIDLPDRDLAHLTEGTATFDRYIAELDWAQRYAALNRDEMMERVLAALSRHMGEEPQESQRINCHHNFTQKERHGDRELWISRKGAIAAHQGQAGLIPGSMGTASYVVEGKGNADAFCSAPHGAGREYSRTRARKTFTLEDLQRAMKGIEYRNSAAFIDEIPAAYKNIDRVMEDASDLVTVVHQFRQLLNVKGD